MYEKKASILKMLLIYLFEHTFFGNEKSSPRMWDEMIFLISRQSFKC